MKKLPGIRLFMFFLLMASLTSCAMVHHYGAYYGKVVDLETKDPLEGAAVLAVYYTEQPGPAGEVTHYVDAQETVTDKSGEFKIPSNTVMTFRPLQYFNSYAYFTIFKPGYGHYPESKGVKLMFVPNGTLPENQHVTIELPRLKTKEERIANVPSSVLNVPEIKQRKYLEAISEEDQYLGLK